MCQQLIQHRSKHFTLMKLEVTYRHSVVSITAASVTALLIMRPDALSRQPMLNKPGKESSRENTLLERVLLQRAE
jgi:hypothetical protein